ncbi:MAG: hypothetical protein ABW065_10550 [Solirubrobacterales bacterium]
MSVVARLRDSLRLAVLAGTVSAALLAPTSAQARTITVGPPLTSPYTVSATFLFPSATVANVAALNDPEANSVSPVDGVVLRWRLPAQGAADAYALRVLHPAGGSAFTGAGTSVSRVASTTSTQTFATSLPIQAGDAIGIDMLKPNPTIKAAVLTGGASPYWTPALAGWPHGRTKRSPRGFRIRLQRGRAAGAAGRRRLAVLGPGRRWNHGDDRRQ